MTINFGDLRRGVAIEVDGQPYEVVDYERQKMQQRAPVTRLRMRNLRDGMLIERTFQSYTTEFSLAQVEDRPAQYLYTDGRFYNFMDMETYDQYQLTKEQLGDAVSYLKEETRYRCNILQSGNHQRTAAHFRGPGGGGDTTGLQGRYGPGRHKARHTGDGPHRTGPPLHK